jgi:hypothetical protein
MVTLEHIIQSDRDFIVIKVDEKKTMFCVL